MVKTCPLVPALSLVSKIVVVLKAPVTVTPVEVVASLVELSYDKDTAPLASQFTYDFVHQQSHQLQIT